jgi:hypothetical protein
LKHLLEKSWESKFITDKLTHGYSSVYAWAINLNPKEFNLLEFGIGGDGIHNGKYLPAGNSLQAWYSTSSNARIYGFDIEERKLIRNERITSFHLDQTDLEASLRVIRDIPLIQEALEIWVDDGLHAPEGFLTVMSTFYQSERTDGVLIIEDLWWPYVWFIFLFLKSSRLSNFVCILRCYQSATPYRLIKFRDLWLKGWGEDFVLILMKKVKSEAR